MAPKSTQVGAMLGSKTVMDPPKSEAKTMSKKCLQKVDFWSHLGGILGRLKQKKCTNNAPGGVDPRGGWIARIARIGKNCQELAWCLSQLHPARRGAPDPLALRANPATVPGVKLVRLVKLVKLVTLSISNQTKIDQHRPQNRPKIVPKSTQNRSKIDQDRPKIELGWGLGAIWAPRWLREPT